MTSAVTLCRCEDGLNDADRSGSCDQSPRRESLQVPTLSLDSDHFLVSLSGSVPSVVLSFACSELLWWPLFTFTASLCVFATCGADVCWVCPALFVLFGSSFHPNLTKTLPTCPDRIFQVVAILIKDKREKLMFSVGLSVCSVQIETLHSCLTETNVV